MKARRHKWLLLSFLFILLFDLMHVSWTSGRLLQNVSTALKLGMEHYENSHSSVATVDGPNVFALLTEPRCIPQVPFVLVNALEKLPQAFKVVFFHSEHNSHCVKQWLNETPLLSDSQKTKRLIVSQDHRMGPNERNIYSPNNWNNVLYTNTTFWQSLYEYGDTALTIQADTLICSNSSNYTPPWKVDYLGGISYVKAHLLRPSNESNFHHMNGGLSIRRLDWVLSCLDSQNKTHAEDSVFNKCANGSKAVSIVDAMKFSSDNGHTKCFDWQGTRHCPWGVHKPWTHQQQGDYKELVRNCPAIEKLRLIGQRGRHEKA